jgi:hypothetical protein
MGYNSTARIRVLFCRPKVPNSSMIQELARFLPGLLQWIPVFIKPEPLRVPLLSILGTFQLRKAKCGILSHWEATKIATLRLVAAMFILALQGASVRVSGAIVAQRGGTWNVEFHVPPLIILDIKRPRDSSHGVPENRSAKNS